MIGDKRGRYCEWQAVGAYRMGCGAKCSVTEEMCDRTAENAIDCDIRKQSNIVYAQCLAELANSDICPFG